MGKNESFRANRAMGRKRMAEDEMEEVNKVKNK